MAVGNATNRYAVAKFIVAPTIAEGATHTTIASALAAASSGDTVFIKPSTYTENLTLKAGVDLCSFDCDALTPNVIILGKASATFAGTCSISGIELKTNTDLILAITGASATVINFKNCNLNGNNASLISNTSSSTSVFVRIIDCRGDLATTGINYFAFTDGTLHVFNSQLSNSGNSVTNNTLTNGASFALFNSFLHSPITSSNTASVSLRHSDMLGGGLNTTMLTLNGTGSTNLNFARIESGTASAISIGAGVTAVINQSVVDSSNTNAITGAGTITFSSITFKGSSNLINTTTQTGNYTDLGKFKASQQTAFLAFLGSSVANVSGDGSVFTFGTTTALTEVYDVGSDFVTSGTFTAPVTGKYTLGCACLMEGGIAINGADLKIVTSNRGYRTIMPRGPGSAGEAQGVCVALADMDAADTCTFTVNTTDTGGKIDDLHGGASPYITFCYGSLEG